MTLPTPDTDGLVGAGAPFPCSLGGREYLIDLSRDGGFIERTIPLLRNQLDGSDSVSESSLNPEDLVRRAGIAARLASGARSIAQVLPATRSVRCSAIV